MGNVECNVKPKTPSTKYKNTPNKNNETRNRQNNVQTVFYYESVMKCYKRSEKIKIKLLKILELEWQN